MKFHILALLALLSLSLRAQNSTAMPPGTRKVYDDIELSRGISIDDPDRLIHYLDDRAEILERGKDPEAWVGDVKYWSEGEFVENEFPKIYPPGTAGVNIACSKHIRIIYGNHPKMTEEYIRGNLRMFEECLKLFYLKLGYPVPFEARDPRKRDGRKHKVDILVGASNLPAHNGKPQYTGGGAYGGYDGERGFGFLYVGPDYMRHTPPSGATPHELGHSVQNHCNTHSPGSGFWWEAHANWLMLQFINSYPSASNVVNSAEFYWGHGRHYYDTWHIFEHLKDEPGFGHEFVRKIWTEGGAAEDMEYIWSKADRFAAQMNPPRSMADEWGKMARRNVTWDYRRGAIFRQQDKGREHWRDGRVLLEPVLHQPGWWRVPREMAPQQFGYNICPLLPTGREVVVDFQGYANPERGSDWRVSLVAVNANGAPRYSPMWGRGTQSFTLQEGEKELFLVVSATPRPMELKPETDYRGLEKERFPYRVKLEGARPLDLLAEPAEVRDRQGKVVAGKAHPNGGGFVAETAAVEPSAFVGPNAKVLGTARISGNARIEDWAVVEGGAVLKDSAVVSGHALVEGNARVEGEARVTDFARVQNRGVVSGRARLMEHAAIRDACRVSEHATMKGRAHSWSERVSGTAILDGDYANNLTVDRNVWFHWFVNTQEKADAAEDLRGLQAQYTFEKAHPYLAWDTYGATHGFLLGAPEIRRDAMTDAERTREKAFLVLNGRDQALELPRDLAFQGELGIELNVRRDAPAPPVEQCLFEFISVDRANRLALILGETGQPRFVAQRAGKESVLAAPYLIPAGKWVRVGVSVSDGGVALLLNGRVAVENPQLLVKPWDMDLQAGYLGRSLRGNYFKGALTDISFYAMPLIDRVPPRPNPAAFELPPTPLRASSLVMRAAKGEEARGDVEYRFADLGKAFDSGWVKSRHYAIDRLPPGRALQVSVTMRDAAGNVGKPSEVAKVTMPQKDAPSFQFEGNQCVIEAEHYHEKLDTSEASWKSARREDFSRGEGIEIPDLGRTADAVAAAAGQAPRLDYRVAFPAAGKYVLNVRAFANHNGNNVFFAGLDFPSSPMRLATKTGRVAWSEEIELEVPSAGVHRVQLWMGKDGLQFDAIHITADAKGAPVGDTPAPAESPVR